DYAMSPGGPGYEFLVSALLEYVRTSWGSAEGFFKAAGVDDETIAAVRARLIAHQPEAFGNDD
ncbi:MAG TPA: hypothetical protein VFQ54_04870, partial [Thermomicrobiales bacterium]|nr:hypothetical protein [Thermomicrobiales bacterium]